MPRFHTRRNNNRIPQHDYSKPGHYFISICTQNRREMFGTIKNNRMVLNDCGNMIGFWWQATFGRYTEIISMDAYIIMPNHMHGIIHIVGADPRIGPISNTQNNTMDNNHIDTGENMVSPLQHNGLGRYISWFKRMTTNQYIRHVKNNHWQPFAKRLWQRNYYDHIIRNDRSLYRTRRYIKTNPCTWQYDLENPSRIGKIR